jgi:hypothetical protein
MSSCASSEITFVPVSHFAEVDRNAGALEREKTSLSFVGKFVAEAMKHRDPLHTG